MPEVPPGRIDGEGGEPPVALPLPPRLPPDEMIDEPLAVLETTNVDEDAGPEIVVVPAEGPPAAPPFVEVGPPPRLPPLEIRVTPLAPLE